MAPELGQNITEPSLVHFTFPAEKKAPCFDSTDSLK